MSKPAGLQCDSCRRLGAKLRMLAGYTIPACDDCAASEFRVERMVNRAREAAK